MNEQMTSQRAMRLLFSLSIATETTSTSEEQLEWDLERSAVHVSRA
jgi:hypothetical protein